MVKLNKFELFARMQRQYHRSNPWRLSGKGLYIPHSYAEKDPDSLSWCDTVGFILNKRRVIVSWQHPRHLYADAIYNHSCQQAGKAPQDHWLIQNSIKSYKIVGKSNSRKKLVGYICANPSLESMAYHEKLRSIRDLLSSEGIDFDVFCSWDRERLNWAMGVNLIAPLEVRNEQELSVVADLARRLMIGQTTLEAEFPGYCYDRVKWLSEQ